MQVFIICQEWVGQLEVSNWGGACGVERKAFAQGTDSWGLKLALVRGGEVKNSTVLGMWRVAELSQFRSFIKNVYKYS